MPFAGGLWDLYRKDVFPLIGAEDLTAGRSSNHRTLLLLLFFCSLIQEGKLPDRSCVSKRGYLIGPVSERAVASQILCQQWRLPDRPCANKEVWLIDFVSAKGDCLIDFVSAGEVA